MGKYSKGAVELFILIILALVVVGGIGYYPYKKGHLSTFKFLE